MANIVDKYENLPGVKVSYEDGNLYSNQQNLQTNTQSVLIIGSAIDGPVGEPVSVAALGGPKAAEKLFGGMLKKVEIETGEVKVDPVTGLDVRVTKTVKVPHQGNLVRTMYEALAAGNEDIRLLRVAGKRAKTELQAVDVAQALEQILGLAKGNVAFSKTLTMDPGGRLSSNPVEYLREKTTAGEIVREFTGAQLANMILNVDTTAGSEMIYFEADKFRPGNNLEVKFGYTKRNYSEVLRTDADGALTKDPTASKYFSSTKLFWSDDISLGHTINVYVDGIGIPELNGAGQRLWRVGKADPAVTNELTDELTALEYEQGGIRFTSAYDVEVTNGVYPAITPTTTGAADYFYYDEIQMTGTNEFLIPGQDTTFTLDYMPNSDSFKMFVEASGVRSELTASTTTNPNGQYTMIFPAAGSTDKAKVVVKSGAVPLGQKIIASYKTNEKTINNPFLVVEGINSGSVYGGIKNVFNPDSVYGVTVQVTSHVTEADPSGQHKIISFRKPEEKMMTSRDQYLEYRTHELFGVRTLREFVNFVNNDPRNNVVRLSVSGDAAEISPQGLLETDGEVSLGMKKNEATGVYELLKDDSKSVNDPAHFPWLGDDGFFNRNDLRSMRDLYQALGGKYEAVEGTVEEFTLVEQGIYNKLENYAVDEIFLAEAHMNTPVGNSSMVDGVETFFVDPYRNFGTQLAQHCAIVTAKTHETVGTIGMEPVANATLGDIQAYIDEVCVAGVNDHFMYNEATGELILSEEGEPMDVGRHLNVVFGPEVGLANDKIGNYITTGAVAYAGLISTLPAEVSTTNKPIAVNGLRYTLSEGQHNQLAGARFVSFEEKVGLNGSRRVVVKDGVTAAQPNSDYQRLSTVRITHATVQLIRRKADPFIGLPNGMAQRNSLATEIQAGLDRLKELGVLQDFKFSIFTSAREKVLGNAFITLELVPQFETRKIFTSVGLRQSL
jgi:hypothetical protein